MTICQKSNIMPMGFVWIAELLAHTLTANKSTMIESSRPTMTIVHINNLTKWQIGNVDETAFYRSRPIALLEDQLKQFSAPVVKDYGR